MPEDATKRGTMLSVASVDAWIATVTQLFTDNEVRGGHSQML